MACKVKLDVFSLFSIEMIELEKNSFQCSPLKRGKTKTIKCLIFTKLFAERFVEQSAFFKTKQTR